VSTLPGGVAGPDQAEITLPGSHFIQEDPGAAIGKAIADWPPT
jgi:hypothetical protein